MMKTYVPYREPATEAAIARSVGDFLKTKTQATRDAWRFACLIIYSGVNVDSSVFATLPSPKPLAPAVEEELWGTLTDMAEIINFLLNPAAVATRRVFILSAVSVVDINLGLALTNAADDETFDRFMESNAVRRTVDGILLQ